MTGPQKNSTICPPASLVGLPSAWDPENLPLSPPIWINVTVSLNWDPQFWSWRAKLQLSLCPCIQFITPFQLLKLNHLFQRSLADLSEAQQVCCHWLRS